MKHLYGLMRLCLVVLALFSTGSYATAQLPAASKAGNQVQQNVESITMSQSGCMFQCPAYTVTVKADGSIEFDGKSYVKVKGKSYGSITPDDYEYLVRSLNKLQFWTWKDQYTPGSSDCNPSATDQTTVTITATTASSKKQVIFYYGCMKAAPASKVYLLSAIIGEIANTEKWIGARDEKKQP
jgi:hypothetical protein